MAEVKKTTPAKRFGIREVADVSFYEVDGATTTPILTLDTLKVSNIEFTAEQTEAKGGKGNAPLIIWDYGREINLTLEDALLSSETLQLLFGNKITADDGTASGLLATTGIDITAETWPGVYQIIGTTWARNEIDGKDELFQFTIPKAKVGTEVTLNMEAEGDPSVFNINLRVLRGNDGKMITFKKVTEAA